MKDVCCRWTLPTLVMGWCVLFAGLTLAQNPSQEGEIPECVKSFISEDVNFLLEVRLEKWELVSETKKVLDLFPQDEDYPLDEEGNEVRIRETFLNILDEQEQSRDRLVDAGIRSIFTLIDRYGTPTLFFPCENPTESQCALVLQELKVNKEYTLSKRTSQGIWLFPRPWNSYSDDVKKTDEELFDEVFDVDPVSPEKFERGWKLLSGLDVKCVIIPPERFDDIPSGASAGARTWARNFAANFECLALGINLEADNAFAHAVFRDRPSATIALNYLEPFLQSVCEIDFSNGNDDLVAFWADLIQSFLSVCKPTQNGAVLTIDAQDLLGKVYDAYFSEIVESFVATTDATPPTELDAKAEADRLAQLIAPWTLNETMVCIHVDLRKVSVAEISRTFFNEIEEIAPHLTSRSGVVSDGLNMMEPLLNTLAQKQKQLLDAGARDFFVLINLSEPEPFIFFLIPLKEVEGREISALRNCYSLVEALPRDVIEFFDAIDFRESGVRDGMLYFVLMDSGPGETITFSQAMDALATPRPQFQDGFELCAFDDVKFVYAMNGAAQTNLLPFALRDLSREFDITNPGARLVARGLDTVAVSFNAHPTKLQLRVLSKTEPAARNFVRAFDRMKSEIRKHSEPVRPYNAMPVGILDVFLDNLILEATGREITLRVPVLQNLRNSKREDFRFITATAGFNSIREYLESTEYVHAMEAPACEPADSSSIAYGEDSAACEVEYPEDYEELLDEAAPAD
ncbi:MAG: hypothetical protein Q4D38_11605 [Planctomycetia bacterium]|nr:hypothetical protein [Planctomycetia bacterium]